jgi:hypothetical protein
MNRINNRLKMLFYPNDINRNQRSLVEINNFKANEFRNLLFYSIIPAFGLILDRKKFTHFTIYIIAMRLMTSKDITQKKIEEAQSLINYFVMQYKTIYGIENMNYKLHAHLHFPLQVQRYGGLNTLSCFPFEGLYSIYIFISYYYSHTYYKLKFYFILFEFHSNL